MHSGIDRTLLGWLVVGWIGFTVLPWYALDDGLFDHSWILAGPIVDRDTASGLFQGLLHRRPWLLPLFAALVLPLAALPTRGEPQRRGLILIAVGLAGLGWLLVQGFAIDHRGATVSWLASRLPPGARQPGIGAGGATVATSLLFVFTHGAALRGAAKGDSFVAGAIGLVVALTLLFVFFPVATVLSSAVRDNAGAFAPGLFLAKVADGRIWGLDCLWSDYRCGVAWNSLFLAVLVGVTTTALGLAFALLVVRTGFRHKRLLRQLTLLPIITPPFVIGLAIILLFGRNGTVTQLVAGLFGVEPGRWIYGLSGIWLAQTLAFTPIAFLVLIGVVEGVSPSLEEAAQTLRADAARTFATISLPLMRPGLANAFLLGFIESLADFGNPLVLSGNFDVLSTEIFFAMVGAQHDAGRAAVLAIVLLGFTLAAFWAQQSWLGRAGYTSVTGKGESGLPMPLTPAIERLCRAVALPWALLTLALYGLIMVGGFVKFWGRDYSFTLEHLWRAFAVVPGDHGLVWSGAAWNSFTTTLLIAAVSALPTAAIGLLTAWLLVRQRFAFQRAFEFATMLSFAIPGTVIGIAYILAFNVPPIEMTGTGLILIVAFVFRNMPVGVRAGIATMAQLDRSLDEASLTLRASNAATVRRILLPLLRPALLAALVYSFVRAMTAISAVVFLVSARYEMATTYILGRVENGDYGLAVAYCCVLIVVMLFAILLFQWLVGTRRLGRRPVPIPALAETPA